MKNIVNQIILLIQFMTRIPIPIKVEYSEKQLGKGIKYFPLVGYLIGIIIFITGIVLNKYIDNKYIISLLLILIELKLVGLIHIDGLADSFDGLFSYRDKDRILEIMKDSRVGTNGVVVLIFYYLAKLILIAEIISRGDMRCLIIYPIIARMSTSVNAGFGVYARDNGMSTGIIGMNQVKDSIFSVILTLLLIILVYYNSGILKGLVMFVAGILFIFYFRRVVYKIIGGITGDTMGASLEMTGLIVLLIGAII